ncbi:hypothetical protein DFJ74DRAFT_680229 [Hyaloraphidium curvatum]|nr:hypothetical protein DFJ74DRAFT_680229 [Hyaloraphidium curvatum]
MARFARRPAPATPRRQKTLSCAPPRQRIVPGCPKAASRIRAAGSSTKDGSVALVASGFAAGAKLRSRTGRPARSAVDAPRHHHNRARACENRLFGPDRTASCARSRRTCFPDRPIAARISIRRDVPGTCSPHPALARDAARDRLPARLINQQSERRALD